MQHVFADLQTAVRPVRLAGSELCACLELEDNSRLYLDHVGGDWVIAQDLLPDRFTRVLGSLARSVYIEVYLPSLVKPGRAVWLAVGGIDSQSVMTTYKLAKITLVRRQDIEGPVDIRLTPISL